MISKKYAMIHTVDDDGKVIKCVSAAEQLIDERIKEAMARGEWKTFIREKEIYSGFPFSVNKDIINKTATKIVEMYSREGYKVRHDPLAIDWITIDWKE